jgi:hypothetical protein
MSARRTSSYTSMPNLLWEASAQRAKSVVFAVSKPLFSNVRRPPPRAHYRFYIGILLLLAWVYSSWAIFYLVRCYFDSLPLTLSKTGTGYTVVVDCGSSGSRIFIYKSTCSGKYDLPVRIFCSGVSLLSRILSRFLTALLVKLR